MSVNREVVVKEFVFGLDAFAFVFVVRMECGAECHREALAEDTAIGNSRLIGEPPVPTTPRSRPLHYSTIGCRSYSRDTRFSIRWLLKVLGLR